MNATRLIAILKHIEEDASIKEEHYLTDGTPHPLVVEACALADDALIQRTGRVDSVRVAELKEAGYLVQRGEYDSFGWLSGVIHTKKGQIVFG